MIISKIVSLLYPSSFFILLIFSLPYLSIIGRNSLWMQNNDDRGGYYLVAWLVLLIITILLTIFKNKKTKLRFRVIAIFCSLFFLFRFGKPITDFYIANNQSTDGEKFTVLEVNQIKSSKKIEQLIKQNKPDILLLRNSSNNLKVENYKCQENFILANQSRLQIIQFKECNNLKYISLGLMGEPSAINIKIKDYNLYIFETLKEITEDELYLNHLALRRLGTELRHKAGVILFAKFQSTIWSDPYRRMTNSVELKDAFWGRGLQFCRDKSWIGRYLCRDYIFHADTVTIHRLKRLDVDKISTKATVLEFTL